MKKNSGERYWYIYGNNTIKCTILKWEGLRIHNLTRTMFWGIVINFSESREQDEYYKTKIVENGWEFLKLWKFLYPKIVIFEVLQVFTWNLCELSNAKCIYTKFFDDAYFWYRNILRYPYYKKKWKLSISEWPNLFFHDISKNQQL